MVYRLRVTLGATLLVVMAACGRHSNAASEPSNTRPLPSSTMTEIPTGVLPTTTAPATSSSLPGQSTTPGGTGAITRCHTSQVKITLESSRGFAGTQRTTFSLGNASSTACFVQGYVGMQMLDRNSAPLVTHLNRLSDQTSQRLVLQSNDAAYFDVSYAATRPGGSPCDAVAPEKLRVTPPDETDSVVISARGPTGELGISACGGDLNVTVLRSSPTP